MDIAGKTIIVLGLGKSGVAAAEMCARHGARVVATDAATAEKLGPAVDRLGKNAAIELRLGGHEGVPWTAADVVVISPGVPKIAEVARAEAAGVPVVGELDMAWQLMADVPTVAIGGTNGKSTTTTLVGEMTMAAGLRSFVGGNLGTPLAEVAPDPGKKASETFDVLVLEVSSFQAERMPAFRPRAATILNVTPDHLDRYASEKDYANAKGNMLVHMSEDAVVVIPANDDVCLHQAKRSPAKTVTFGRAADIAIEPDAIVDHLRNRRYPRADIRLTGEHNMLNAAASIALATAIGVPEDAIRRALRTFEGLAHRIAFAGEIQGVRFYDDSKGTNVGAAVAALRGMSEPKVVLIAGGRDKLGSYAPLVDALRDKGRAAVLLGEAADAIEKALGGVVPVARAATMEAAVKDAFAAAKPGDAVLLSPACSSFDMFRDYKHRGEVFVAAVRALARSTKERSAR